MPTAHAAISIPTPARYMSRLCNHFAHRVSVQKETDRARVDFHGALCSLVATEDQLEIRIEAPDTATLGRLQEVVARHLKQVAAAETFDVQWTVAES